MHAYRSHTCAQLSSANVGEATRLSGWVHRVRDHGGLLFIDLRDHYGMTQIVADPDSPAFETAEAVRGEWVIRVDGEVRDYTAVYRKVQAVRLDVLAKVSTEAEEWGEDWRDSA